MKKFGMTGVVLLSMCFALSCPLPAYSYADYSKPESFEYDDTTQIKEDDILYFNDFSEYGIDTVPAGFNITAANETSVKIASVETPEKKQKNALWVHDDAANGNVGFDINFEGVQEPFFAEIRFRFVKSEDPFNSFCLDFNSDASQAFRIVQWSAGEGINYWSNSGYNLSLTARQLLTDGEWYLLQLHFDPDSKMVDVQMQSEALKGLSSAVSGVRFSPVVGASYAKGLSVNNDFSGEAIDKIQFQTSSKTGDYYFDYFKVLKNREVQWMGPKPEKIPAPVMLPPILKPLPDIINVNFDGEYMYFIIPPAVTEDTVYIPARNISSWCGLSFRTEGESYLLTDEKTKIILGENKSEISLNEKVLQMKHPVIRRDNILYVPALDFFPLLGYSAAYDGNELVITKGGAQR